MIEHKDFKSEKPRAPLSDKALSSPNDQDQRQLRPNVVLEAARSCAVRCIAWLGRLWFVEASGVSPLISYDRRMFWARERPRCLACGVLSDSSEEHNGSVSVDCQFCGAQTTEIILENGAHRLTVKPTPRYSLFYIVYYKLYTYLFGGQQLWDSYYNPHNPLKRFWSVNGYCNRAKKGWLNQRCNNPLSRSSRKMVEQDQPDLIALSSESSSQANRKQAKTPQS